MMAKGVALTEREGLFQGWFSPRLDGFVSRLVLASPHPCFTHSSSCLESGDVKVTFPPTFGHSPFWDVPQGHSRRNEFLSLSPQAVAENHGLTVDIEILLKDTYCRIETCCKTS